jgi:hypothetical protein
MTVFQDCIGLHNITTVDKPLVDHGANGTASGACVLGLEVESALFMSMGLFPVTSLINFVFLDHSA